MHRLSHILSSIAEQARNASTDGGQQPPTPKQPRQPNVPIRQPYYMYSTDNRRWQSVTPPAQPPVATSASLDPAKGFTVHSWNIDFRIPLGDERITAALNHLYGLISQSPSQLPSSASSATTGSTATVPTPAKPSIIFLQEMTPSDLQVIQAQPWIQTRYYLTDVSSERWNSSTYGTCTLIDRRLKIRDVFRVYYQETVMERDGLFVDIDLGHDGGDNSGSGDHSNDDSERGCLRLCNTHLESLALQPPRRPPQMACAARYMRGEEGTKVLGSVLGGDLNAIEPFDETLPSDNGLGDAYLALGGREGHEDGFTWGQMAKTREREKYGLSRMDKFLFCGAIKVNSFERFGYGVEIEGEKKREELMRLGFDAPWVTDHLGIKGEFSC